MRELSSREKAFNETVIAELLRQARLTPVGATLAPNEGRIAQNYITNTAELGHILIRVRPTASTTTAVLLGYTNARFAFEVEAIKFLSERGLPLPRLIPLDGERRYLVTTADYEAYAYVLIPGRTIPADQLTPLLVHQVSTFLLPIFEIAATYKPAGTVPIGDIKYIDGIFTSYIKAHNVLDEDTRSMMSHLQDQESCRRLEGTPSGICHGDLFSENIICDEDAKLSIIDFGDAYYGRIIMDITTAAMEFSFIGPELDQNRMSAFLRPLAGWLNEHKIDFDVFHYSMLANCIRFATHTLQLETVESGENSAGRNQYVERFFLLRDKAKTDLGSVFADARNHRSHSF